MCNRRCEGLLGVALQSGTVSLSLSTSLSLSDMNNAASCHSSAITTLNCLTLTSRHSSNTLTVQGHLSVRYPNATNCSSWMYQFRLSVQFPTNRHFIYSSRTESCWPSRRLGVLPTVSHKTCCRPTICTKHPVYTPALCCCVLSQDEPDRRPSRH